MKIHICVNYTYKAQYFQIHIINDSSIGYRKVIAERQDSVLERYKTEENTQYNTFFQNSPPQLFVIKNWLKRTLRIVFILDEFQSERDYIDSLIKYLLNIYYNSIKVMSAGVVEACMRKVERQTRNAGESRALYSQTLSTS